MLQKYEVSDKILIKHINSYPSLLFLQLKKCGEKYDTY